MDCPICKGNGELEFQDSQSGKEHEHVKLGAHRDLVTICFRCGGTGYLEQND